MFFFFAFILFHSSYCFTQCNYQTRDTPENWSPCFFFLLLSDHFECILEKNYSHVYEYIWNTRWKKPLFSASLKNVKRGKKKKIEMISRRFFCMLSRLIRDQPCAHRMMKKVRKKRLWETKKYIKKKLIGFILLVIVSCFKAQENQTEETKNHKRQKKKNWFYSRYFELLTLGLTIMKFLSSQNMFFKIEKWNILMAKRTLHLTKQVKIIRYNLHD